MLNRYMGADFISLKAQLQAHNLHTQLHVQSEWLHIEIAIYTSPVCADLAIFFARCIDTVL